MQLKPILVKTHTPGRVGFILFGVGRMGTVCAHAVLANRKSDLFYAVDIHEPRYCTLIYYF